MLAAGGLLLVVGILIGVGAGRLGTAAATTDAAGLGKGTRASLTIRIQTTSGKLVKTLKSTTSTDKSVLSWNFNCALPKGQYRVGAQVTGIACTQ